MSIKKIKHNKLRNIGIVFEALNSAVTELVLENKVKESAQLFEVITKWFGHGTYLGKIYREYYEPILNGQARNHFFASRLLKYLKENYRVDEHKLNREINLLIEDLDKICNRKEIFNRKLGNFKVFASYKSLIDEYRGRIELNPQQTVACEQFIISHFLENKEIEKRSNAEKMLSETRSDEDATDAELFNVMYIKKFKEHYGPQLTEEQNTFITKYLTSESDRSFKRYAEKKLKSILDEIDRGIDTINDDDIRDKLKLAKQKLSTIDILESLDSDDIADIMSALEIKDGLKLY